MLSEGNFSLTSDVDTHLRISADCSRSWKMLAVVIWKVWRCSDSADGTNANRSCGNLRSMRSSRLLWWSGLARLQPTAGPCSFHPQQLLWNIAVTSCASSWLSLSHYVLEFQQQTAALQSMLRLWHRLKVVRAKTGRQNYLFRNNYSFAEVGLV